jgi:stage II sporulation protein D
VPLPSRLHAQIVMPLRTAAATLLIFAMVSWGNWPVAAPAPPSPRSQDPSTDVALETASNGRTVRIGALSGDAATVVVPLELYIARVLVGEAEPTAADASLQALAIAARTFTVVNMGRHEGFDLCDTTHCQVWRPAASMASRRAVLATAGQVLTYNGVPAEVFYSASCGGHTERAGDVWARGALFPYLQGVPDDVHQNDTPWRLERTLDDVREAVARAGARGARLEDVVVEARSATGRVLRVGLPGLTPESLTGDQFRGALGFTELRSTAFTMERAGDRFRFEGRGYGHGVGMCVIGAGRRAQRGDSAEAILAHYFPALTLSWLDDLPATRTSPVR